MVPFRKSLTCLFFTVALIAHALPLMSQNCEVDFPATATRSFSSACGGSTCSNLTIGKNTAMGNGDTFTFDLPVINISGNVEINAEGSGKIIIPAGVTVNIEGNIHLKSKNSNCTSSNPCVFEIVVNGTLNMDKHFRNDMVTVVWSGAGLVDANDKFENSSNGCMACGTGGCPDFNMDDDDCSDNGSECAGDFCAVLFECSSDAIKPVITGCPADQTINMAGPGCSQAATWFDPEATDNCSLTSFTSNFSSGYPFPKGETTVTYTATDANDNVATCSFKITVVDTSAPVITGCPADIRVDAGTECSADVMWLAPDATDNCGTPTIINSHDPGQTFQVGKTEVVYTVTDQAGNVSVCRFNIIVENNNSRPQFANCPDDITVDADETGMAVVTWIEPVASALCSDVVVTATHAPGGAFAIGTTNVEYLATDASENTASCAFTITVNPAKINIGVSKVITPDGNGINDQWILTNIGAYRHNRVTVRDRWGAVIFTATGYNNQDVTWDGTTQSGGLAPTGTYFYSIKVNYGAHHSEKTGSIELIR
jgi:gliding motility-associated-like protein